MTPAFRMMKFAYHTSILVALCSVLVAAQVHSFTTLSTPDVPQHLSFLLQKQGQGISKNTYSVTKPACTLSFMLDFFDSAEAPLTLCFRSAHIGIGRFIPYHCSP